MQSIAEPTEIGQAVRHSAVYENPDGGVYLLRLPNGSYSHLHGDGNYYDGVACASDCLPGTEQSRHIALYPYAVSLLVEADSSCIVYLVGSEREADLLIANGYVATTVPYGFRGFDKSLTHFFDNKPVVILAKPDGWAAAQWVKRILLGKVYPEVILVDLPASGLASFLGGLDA